MWTPLRAAAPAARAALHGVGAAHVKTRCFHAVQLAALRPSTSRTGVVAAPTAHGTYTVPLVLARTASTSSATTSNDARRAELDAFAVEFLSVVTPAVARATDPRQSATLLRTLVRSGLLKYTDMRDDPEKFFLAHRLLATIGLGGFGIRFTVQFNLFAGSILGLGTDAQVEELEALQPSGELGCFLLTEMQAGVLSGLIVKTTATWDVGAGCFVLRTPDDAAAKNWISQGFTASKGVVLADLIDGEGASHGPHAFVMDLREEAAASDSAAPGGVGALRAGVRVEDMGSKTVANDLDNARVWFDGVQLPHGALLARFATVDAATGAYEQCGDEPMRLEVIGQRLLTGRLAIAEAALVSARVLFAKTEAYAAQKVCNGLGGEVKLAALPQLAATFAEGGAELDRLLAYCRGVEDRLAACLRAGTIPDAPLVEAIAVAKIRAIAVATERAHALRQEVGSYALMGHTGFELADMFLCCKFAEGDSRILQQKLARDRLKALQRGGVAGAAAAIARGEWREVVAAAALGRTLAAAGRDDPAALSAAWDGAWREVYALADLVADRYEREAAAAPGAGGFAEPIIERLQRFDTGFDADWKDKL